MEKRKFFKIGKNKILIPVLIVIIILSGIMSFFSCNAFVNKKEVIPISVEKVNEIMEKNKDYIILDVRTQQEYDSGYLKNSLLIPVDELEERINEVPKGKPIIVYCRSGNRSARAADILINNGFSPVYDMQGGILEWIEKGYPVEYK